jgi:hypothetical protein
MTVDELLSLAVNVANGWSLEDLGLDPTTNPVALRKMLAEVWELLLDAHQKVVEHRYGRASKHALANVDRAQATNIDPLVEH